MKIEVRRTEVPSMCEVAEIDLDDLDLTDEQIASIEEEPSKIFSFVKVNDMNWEPEYYDISFPEYDFTVRKLTKV